MIGYEERGVKTANGKTQKECEQVEAQPDGYVMSDETNWNNGLCREPFPLQSYRGYGR